MLRQKQAQNSIEAVKTPRAEPEEGLAGKIHKTAFVVFTTVIVGASLISIAKM